jgi:predicted HAD superfamily Cof-like phosphohydrolase
MTPEEMVREFHRTKQVHVNWMPSVPTADIPEQVRDSRLVLLREEVQELEEAVAAGDLVKIADALGDIEYVTRGTAVVYGIPSDAVFEEVHRSNMTKDNSSGQKLVKGPGYEPPRIARILEAAWLAEYCGEAG